MHIEGMSINNPKIRKHHPNIRPGSGHDVFFKIGRNQFRLWNQQTDGSPQFSTDMAEKLSDMEEQSDTEVVNSTEREFAFEHDLRDYLARNLAKIEAGLKLYEEEEIRGIEFPVGGRFIDILAIDSNDDYVVIELKVSRGYDRTIGQLLRYMGWIEANLAAGKKVRGVIVASKISEDLKLAASRIRDVKLFEYKISLSVRGI